jgi:hypothetical protein
MPLLTKFKMIDQIGYNLTPADGYLGQAFINPNRSGLMAAVF